MAIASYGGNPALIATRNEIERVRDSISAVQQALASQIELDDFLTATLQRVHLAMALPSLFERMRQIVLACDLAADSYFGTENSLAARMREPQIAVPMFAELTMIGAAAFGFWPSEQISVSLIKQEAGSTAAESMRAMTARLSAIEVKWQPVIRVERYGETLGERKFVVYIPGTQSWSPITTGNPLDARSNIAAMAGPGLAASELGVRAALAAAGARKEEKVLLIGHSQGGLLAMNIASDNRGQKIAGVVTIGSPVGQFKPINQVPVLSIEHNQDIVPRLGGKSNSLATDWVTVVRDLPKENINLVEAHDIGQYVSTAELVDQDQTEGLVRIRDQITNFVRDEKAVVSFYELKQKH